jgi:hypothetical protein
MYINRTAINATAAAHGGTAFANAHYWTSTEHSALEAFSLNYVNGSQIRSLKTKNCSVRAIRSF